MILSALWLITWLLITNKQYAKHVHLVNELL